MKFMNVGKSLKVVINEYIENFVIEYNKEVWLRS